MLHTMFMHNCVTSASEADSERTYSDIGRIHTDDRNRLTVQSIESCVLVAKLQFWEQKLGTAEQTASFFRTKVDGRNESEVSARDAWSAALSSNFSANQLQFFYAQERSIVNKHRGASLHKGCKVIIWYVGHNRPTHYTLREVIGDVYKGGPLNGQPSEGEKGNWTLGEGARLSEFTLDVAKDEWELVGMS